jgi:transposase
MSKLSFKDQEIKIGIDVHKNSWSTKFLSRDVNLGSPTFSGPSKAEQLASYAHKMYPDANFECAYEAGFCGFWIQEKLTKLGLPTIVVNPADIPTNDKERAFKEDRRDSLKIAKALRSDMLEPIYVPSLEDQENRSLVRQKYRMARDIRRTKNRIKSHLAFYGKSLLNEEGKEEKYWSNRVITKLENKAIEENDHTLQGWVSYLKVQRLTQLNLVRSLRTLSKSEKYKESYEKLYIIQGVGLLTAMVFLTEIMDIGRFSNQERYLSYIGLIPGTNSSGSKSISTGITHRGNKQLRSALVLSAWVAIQTNPEMTLYYQKQKANKPANKAIIKVARKLATEMRYTLINK